MKWLLRFERRLGSKVNHMTSISKRSVKIPSSSLGSLEACRVRSVTDMAGENTRMASWCHCGIDRMKPAISN